MDPEPLAFIRALYANNRRKYRVLLIGCWALIFLPPVIWVACLTFSTGHLLWKHVTVVTLILAIPGIAISIPSWLVSRSRLLRVARDSQEGTMAYNRSPFRKTLVQNGAVYNLAQIYSVKLPDVRIFIPVRAYKGLSKEGDATFCYFPHTRLCWTVDAKCVWTHGDYWFW